MFIYNLFSSYLNIFLHSVLCLISRHTVSVHLVICTTILYFLSIIQVTNKLCSRFALGVCCYLFFCFLCLECQLVLLNIKHKHQTKERIVIKHADFSRACMNVALWDDNILVGALSTCAWNIHYIKYVCLFCYRYVSGTGFFACNFRKNARLAVMNMVVQ